MTWGTFIDLETRELHLLVDLDGGGELFDRACPVAECRVWPHEGFPPAPKIGDVVYHVTEDAASVYADLHDEGPSWHRLLAASHTQGVTREANGTTEVFTDQGWVKARKVGHFWQATTERNDHEEEGTQET